MEVLYCAACDRQISEWDEVCPYCNGSGNPVDSMEHTDSQGEIRLSKSGLESSEGASLILHALPWVGLVLLLLVPATVAGWVNCLVVVASGVLMALESGRKGSQNWGGALLWFVGAVLLWVLFYPLYMFRRTGHGMESNMLLCLLGALAYAVASVVIVWPNILQHGLM